MIGRRKDAAASHVQDLLGELAEIQRLRARQVYGRKRSRLDRYRFEIMILYAHGASYRDIQRLLRRKRVVVSHTTIRVRVLIWLAQTDQPPALPTTPATDAPDCDAWRDGDASPEA